MPQRQEAPQDLESPGEWQTLDQPPAWTLGTVWSRYGIDMTWLGLYVAANALVFWLRFRQYEADPCVARGPAVAKGSAEVIVFNCVLTLVAICHRVLDKLRGHATVSPPSPIAITRPIEMHRECHVLTGSVVLAMSLVHSAAWGLILHWCATCDARDWQRSALSTRATTRLRTSASLLALPMWTGIVMACGALVLLPFGVGAIRRTWFTAFESVHRVVLVPFLVLLLFHGAAQWTSRLQAPLWLVPALVVYAVERRSRLSQCTKSTIVGFDTTRSAASSSTIIRLFLLKTERFQRCFEPGMFMYLQVSAIASFEWHPFSVCSSADDALVELHVRVVGDWTKQLLTHLEEAASPANGLDHHTLAPVAIPVRLDGPFGTPTLHCPRYDSVLLVALGMGVAPFLSVLRHQLHAQRRTQRQPTTSTTHLQPQRLALVWVVRDLALVEWVAETLREFDDVVGRMGRDVWELQVFVTTDHHVDALALLLPASVRVHCKARGGRPHWPRVLDEWTAASPPSTVRRAVFVSGSRAVTSAIKHAVARARLGVDVYAERFH